MAGLVVTALVSALVAFGVASLIPPGPAPAPPPAASSTGVPAELRKEVDRLRREVEELRAAKPVPIRAGPKAAAGNAGAPPAGTMDAEAGAGTDPGGRLPSTRDKLVALIDERLDARAPAATPAGPPYKPAKRMTIEEAGAELGLSSVDIDSVRRVWQESEMEALTMMMGTGDVDAIKEEVKAAEEDPDRKAALINKVVGNMFRNLGKFATIEGRRNRELKKFLTEDQVKKLKGMNIAPVTEGGGLEGIMKGTFGD
jgi:hypothetical protein